MAKLITIEPTFEAWRATARRLVLESVTPDAVLLRDTRNHPTLAFGGEPDAPFMPQRTMRAPREFVDLARTVSCHRDAGRWDLLYRVLWRLQAARDLIRDEIDPDMYELRRLKRQVDRDVHKAHAFVRFRMVHESGREHAIAWHQPEHYILPLAAPFFAHRFPQMHWTILTSDESVSWSVEKQALEFGPGVPRDAAPADDQLEEVWRIYYRSIFNPARLNTAAMRAEMPIRYWSTLPELSVLPGLLASADRRVTAMIDTQSKQTAQPFVPASRELPVLAAYARSCRGCSLCETATQTVFGQGRADAKLMLVGEQPGDKEDRRGEPFIGPAGQVLDRALRLANIERGEIYLTNAVKHFKFVERGKRRLHQSPRLSEIVACRPWLLAEIEAVQPKCIVCLGASAAKSLLGAKFALMQDRGRIFETAYGQVLATVHPSAVLRAQDPAVSDQLFYYVVNDLTAAADAAGFGSQPAVAAPLTELGRTRNI